MTELIEAVARGICHDEWTTPGTDLEPEEIARLIEVYWQRWTDAAQAALTAISDAGYRIVKDEPTPGMINRGVDFAIKAKLGGGLSVARLHQGTVLHHDCSSTGRREVSAPAQIAARDARVSRYLSEQTAARDALNDYPDAVRDRLEAWQEHQREWFSPTVLEIVAEFIAFEDALKAMEEKTDGE